ncbi:MAG: hypothetical protein ABWK53_01340 [Anaerolineales bacterium]
MKTKTLWIFALLLLSACRSQTAAPASPPIDVVGTSVAAALTSVPPQPTFTPYPTYTPYPTPDLSGLFCEYEFCIGHPDGVPFFDLEVVNDYLTHRSSYEQGILIGFSDSVYIFFAWSRLYGDYDPNVMLTTVLLADTPQETRLTADFGGRAVTYVALASTPSTILPQGLAAAWQCGDRQFGWKAYTNQQAQALDLLNQALARFRCNLP